MTGWHRKGRGLGCWNRVRADRERGLRAPRAGPRSGCLPGYFCTEDGELSCGGGSSRQSEAAVTLNFVIWPQRGSIGTRRFSKLSGGFMSMQSALPERSQPLMPLVALGLLGGCSNELLMTNY